jgi:hypothetical protein
MPNATSEQIRALAGKVDKVTQFCYNYLVVAKRLQFC